MKTRESYINRLTAVGVRLDDAIVIVSDFGRELDFSGLEDYVCLLEEMKQKCM